jgi:mono/diheme cytochrome c family protein
VLACLAACAVLGACKDETIDDYPCPAAGTTLTYESFGRNFLTQNCQICHGQSADNRNGAPPNFDFGTLDQVHEHRDRIFARAAAGNTSMPPGPDDPPRADRDKLAEWLACGAP